MTFPYKFPATCLDYAYSHVSGVYSHLENVFDICYTHVSVTRDLLLAMSNHL